jgi:hypothetical protein
LCSSPDSEIGVKSDELVVGLVGTLRGWDPELEDDVLDDELDPGEIAALELEEEVEIGGF